MGFFPRKFGLVVLILTISVLIMQIANTLAILILISNISHKMDTNPEIPKGHYGENKPFLVIACYFSFMGIIMACVLFEGIRKKCLRYMLLWLIYGLVNSIAILALNLWDRSNIKTAPDIMYYFQWFILAQQLLLFIPIIWYYKIIKKEKTQSVAN